MPLTKRRSGLSSSALTGLDTVIPVPTAEAAAATPGRPAKPAGTDTTTGAKEKLVSYVPKELLESVKVAVSALGSHQDDPAASPSSSRTPLAPDSHACSSSATMAAPSHAARRQLVARRRPD